jgi:hypothetical protein
MLKGNSVFYEYELSERRMKEQTGNRIRYREDARKVASMIFLRMLAFEINQVSEMEKESAKWKAVGFSEKLMDPVLTLQ